MQSKPKRLCVQCHASPALKRSRLCWNCCTKPAKETMQVKPDEYAPWQRGKDIASGERYVVKPANGSPLAKQAKPDYANEADHAD